MIKAVFFDLFTTLVDVGSVPLSEGRMTADIFSMTAEEWNALCFSSEHEICKPTKAIDVIRSLIHSHNPDISDELIHQATIERQNRFDYALTQHIQNDVLEGLAKLKHRGYQLILVSNASTAEVQAWSDSPLVEFFEHSVFSCAVGVKKPDKAIYKHACELALSEPHQCLFVGDGGSNELIGAKQFGMQTLLMTRFLKAKKESRRESFSDVIDGEVDSTMQVLEWLTR